MENAERLTIHFSGAVQGVGFRYTALQVSRRFNVTGFVKNLRDGRVELVAEGEADELTRFRSAVEKAMNGYISNSNAIRTEPTGEFNVFDIAFR